MKKSILFISLFIFAAAFTAEGLFAGQFTLTVLYDNYSYREGTISDWGFSCLIEGGEKTVLFDTGTDGNLLLQNVETLKLDLTKIDCIVLSHNHRDHTGGLGSVLKTTPDASVYFPVSFPQDFSQDIRDQKAIPISVDDPLEICSHVFSTGEIQGVVNEQSLILETKKGLIVITGCSHPGITTILKRAKAFLKQDIYLVFGGFHLLRHTDEQVQAVIREFKSLGVEKCGATHCTGDRAIGLFKEAYGENYVPMGVGQVVHLSY